MNNKIISCLILYILILSLIVNWQILRVIGEVLQKFNIFFFHSTYIEFSYRSSEFCVSNK
jgi:hypothetical protein